MTPISLLDSDPESLRLPQLPTSKIHYPTDGAGLLADIEQVSFWHRTRLNIVLKTLRREFGFRPGGGFTPVGLDIGCGTGWTATQLTLHGFTTLGIDGFSRFSTAATNRGARLFHGDILGFTPLAEFDYILLVDVIEHIKDDAGFIRQSMRFLKPGGIAVIHVPALQRLWSPADDYAGHLRRYTRHTLRESIRNAARHSVSPANAEEQNDIRLDSIAFHYASMVPALLLSHWINRRIGGRKPDWEIKFRLPRWLNETMLLVLSLEEKCVPLLPFGSSLLAVVRKVRQAVPDVYPFSPTSNSLSMTLVREEHTMYSDL